MKLGSNEAKSAFESVGQTKLILNSLAESKVSNLDPHIWRFRFEKDVLTTMSFTPS